MAALWWRSSRRALAAGHRRARKGDFAGAERAYQRAIDSGHAHGAPAGMVNLAHLRKDIGDEAGAREYYRRAVAAKHPAWSLRAALELAESLEKHGATGEAIDVCEWAVGFGDPTQSANAVARLAAAKLDVLLSSQGEHAKARALRDRVTRGVPEKQALYAINRAHELKARGDIEAAAASLREAVELDDPTVSARAAAMLSRLRLP